MTAGQHRSDNLWPQLESYLIQHNRLRKAGATLVADSPLRSDSNSLALRLTPNPTAPGGGVWYDQVAKEGGSFIDLARICNLIDDAAYASTAGLPQLQTFESVEAYERHQLGEYNGAFERFGWRMAEHFCPVLGKPRPALAFPTRTGERYRFTDGLKPKYMHGRGYRASLYGLTGVRNMLSGRTALPLVLCNGEASVVVAQEWGVPALCITGGGERGIPQHLVADFGALLVELLPEQVLIAMDSDSTGRQAAHKLLAQVQSIIDASAITVEVRAVDLQGTKGYDLANFCKVYGADAVKGLLALPDAPLPEKQRTVAEVEAELAQARAEVEQWKQVSARQAEMIAERDAQLQAIKEFQRWHQDVVAAPTKVKSPGLRNTVVALRKMLEHDPVEAAAHNGRVRINIGQLAEMAGNSAPTAGRHLRDLEDAKLIRKDKEFDWIEHDGAGATPQTTIYVTPLVDFSDPDQIVVASKQGGKRIKRCTECGSVRMVTKVVEYCEACGTTHGEPVIEYINDEAEVSRELDAGGPPATWVAGQDLADDDERAVIDALLEDELGPEPASGVTPAQVDTVYQRAISP
jgi:DNA-binding transcriptional ArsR family regulator